MSTYVYVDPVRAARGAAPPCAAPALSRRRSQNRGAYGQPPQHGYDARAARKAVQRRVVDYTSTVARNLQARRGSAAAPRVCPS